jgi:hypothetical protein
MKTHSIYYFDQEGRENWEQVLRLVKRAFKRRPEFRSYKVVIFTAIGEGPALAYNLLQDYLDTTKIIAVTFPPDFTAVRDGQTVSPRIFPKAKTFFDGVGIPVVTARLPFQAIEGVEGHNQQMKLIGDVLTLFGGSFSLSVQAVLQACDHGLVEVGEKVIAVTGDSAAVITASSTTKFLNREQGLAINEIICKARNMTIARGQPAAAVEQSRSLFDQNTTPRLKATPPKRQQLIEGKETHNTREKKQQTKA